jgi:methyltransferase-like protein 6
MARRPDEPYFEPYLPYTSVNGLYPNRVRAKTAAAAAHSRQRWTAFYDAHETRFFKDRHWIQHEWTELCDESRGDRTVLDVGCGVGNALFPLLAANPRLSFHAFDLAPSAVRLVRENPLFDAARVNAFVCDISVDELPLPDASCDFVIVIFVLSALMPHQFRPVLESLVRVLKPGGLIYIRDYAVGDKAQQRFDDNELNNKLDDNLYVRRSDGTSSYFFDVATVQSWFADWHGVVVEQCEVVERIVENRKLEKTMHRLFLQVQVRKSINHQSSL